VTPRFLRTTRVLPILQAAISGDPDACGKLRAANPGTANTLTPVLEALDDGNQKLTEVARQAVAALELGASILVTNGVFIKESRGIMDHVTSVAAAVEEMAAAAVEISNNAQHAAHRADDSNAKATTGNESLSSLIGDIDLLEKSVSSMANNMKQFLGFSSEINKLTAIVKDIARQTNLLALNAAIEAARAGEAGRGFAVVADEVKKLADKTAQATGEIESVTGTMNALTGTVNASVNASLEHLAQSVSAVETVATVLGEGSRVVREVNDRVHQIAAAAEEQSAVAGEMARNLSDIKTSLKSESQQVETVNDHARSLSRTTAQQLNVLAAWKQEELLLQIVKADHLMWKARLADVLHGDGGMREDELKDHTQCRLGHWFAGAGKARYGDVAVFREMEAPHARVHALGREIVQLAAADSFDAALAKFREMEQEGGRLFALIDRLAQAMNEKGGH
jgi:methyl-accepting chemotaxis protein